MNSNVENLPPHIIRLVYKEVTTLTADPPDGIKVFPNEEDLTDLQVTIEGPGLLPDQDLPPECGRQWRDLRQRAQEGLDG
uniref:Ubiquitin conjugating enzyme E2 S n=1 Tax=Mandrillus leucophaeus TaxID=9568 RepID=A0A2K6ADZ1_MANLE